MYTCTIELYWSTHRCRQIFPDWGWNNAENTHIFFHENNSYIQMRNEFMISMQTGHQSTKNNTGLTMFDMHK
jgi:hypothetical protein